MNGYYLPICSYTAVVYIQNFFLCFFCHQVLHQLMMVLYQAGSKPYVLKCLWHLLFCIHCIAIVFHYFLLLNTGVLSGALDIILSSRYTPPLPNMWQHFYFLLITRNNHPSQDCNFLQIQWYEESKVAQQKFQVSVQRNFLFYPLGEKFLFEELKSLKPAQLQ